MRQSVRLRDEGKEKLGLELENVANNLLKPRPVPSFSPSDALSAIKS